MAHGSEQSGDDLIEFFRGDRHAVGGLKAIFPDDLEASSRSTKAVAKTKSGIMPLVPKRMLTHADYLGARPRTLSENFVVALLELSTSVLGMVFETCAVPLLRLHIFVKWIRSSPSKPYFFYKVNLVASF